MSWNPKRAWLVLKTAVAVAILVAVGRNFAITLSSPELASFPFRLRFAFLVPAGLLYLLAHCCWASFWVRLLRSQGVHVSWYGGLRAYFVSQFGKYVPGKAWVILLRVGMLRAVGGRPLPVAVTATYETLSSMAAGALLGVLLLPWLVALPDVVSGNVVALAAIAGLPIVLGVLNKLVVRVAQRSREPDAPSLPSPSPWLLAQGLLHGACGWCLLGVSLGLVIRGVVPDPPAWDVPAYMGDLAAICLSYVLGFAVLVAPGGLGVREYLLKLTLTPRFTGAADAALAEGQAVVVALVLRLTWSVMELCWTLGLWWFGHPSRLDREK